MTRIIPNKRDKLNTLYKLLRELADEQEEKLVIFCLKEGYTFLEIAKALGTTKQAVNAKYSNLFKEVKRDAI